MLKNLYPIGEVILRRLGISALLDSPFGILLSLALVIAMVELLIMIAIPMIAPHVSIPHNYWDFMDALLLTMIVSPALYFLVFRKMRRRKQEWLDLVEQASDPIFTYDCHGRCISVNHAACEVFGYSREEFMGFGMRDLVHPEDLEKLAHPDEQAKLKLMLEGRMTINAQRRLRRKDGSYVTVDVSAKKLTDGRILSNKRDVTEHTQIVADLKESERSLRQAQSTANIGSWNYDLSTGKLIWSEQLYRIYGVSPETFTPSVETLVGLIHPNDQAAMQAWITASVSGKKPEALEFRCVWPDGTIRFIEGQSELILDAEGKPSSMSGTGQDITERKRIEEEITNLAFYDALTKLPNRYLLDDRLSNAIAASKRSDRFGAAMFLDLDNFKQLNDTHGHKAGDLLLVEVARRFAQCVREVDTVARFGGDEFVVVLSELCGEKFECLAQANLVAEKIRTTLAEPYYLTRSCEDTTKMIVNHHCSASIGVVIFNGQANAENILKWADKAMYQAKNAGRNQIRFYETSN